MARKRGGLAGLWDRNKKIIAPVATGLAGLFNPLAGAAVGAAFKGLDRPGQRGVGFDVKQGAMGALQGYGMGSALGDVKKKGAQALKGLFTGGGGAAGAAGGGTGGTVLSKTGTAMDPKMLQRGTSIVQQAAGSGTGAATGVATKAATSPSLLGRLGAAATSKEGLAALGGAAKATAGVIESQQARALEQRQLDEEEQRRQRLAELMLLFLPQMQFGPEALGALGQGRMSGGMG